MAMNTLLGLAAVLEAVTGLALMIRPALVAQVTRSSRATVLPSHARIALVDMRDYTHPAGNCVMSVILPKVQPIAMDLCD